MSGPDVLFPCWNAPRRPGDVTAIWADPTLANRELGWKAGRSIEDTLAAAWAWEKHLAGK